MGFPVGASGTSFNDNEERFYRLIRAEWFPPALQEVSSTEGKHLRADNAHG